MCVMGRQAEHGTCIPTKQCVDVHIASSHDLLLGLERFVENQGLLVCTVAM